MFSVEELALYSAPAERGQFEFSEHIGFHRKCINKKFMDEELERYPVCDIPLSAVPSEKLRREQKKKKVGKKVKVRARAGPKGFGQKIDD
ncbi:hypothetical protein Patl1_32785 [Pistacia atlantica]|uniref:Uncharacterized protein n=1 Tax=Pistacia atlantica TaxID=434234 RepID=A0ACC1APS8_9ROSI|nr:hypothetical protein Patl1_32785 [Pistacia atlantica]